MYVVSDSIPILDNVSDISSVYVVGVKTKRIEAWLKNFTNVVYLNKITEKETIPRIKQDINDGYLLIINTSSTVPKITIDREFDYCIMDSLSYETTTKIKNLFNLSKDWRYNDGWITDTYIGLPSNLCIIQNKEDIKFLKKLMYVNPSNVLLRIAEVYLHENKLKQAIIYYNKCYNLKQNKNYIFFCLYRIGTCLLSLKDPLGVSILLDAWNYNTNRIEPLVELVKYYKLNNKYDLAFLFGLSASTINARDDFYMIKSYYNYILDYEMIFVCLACKEYKMAKIHYNNVLVNGTQEYIDKVKEINIHS